MTDFKTPFDGYDVLKKWDTPSWNDQTRSVVRKRLEQVPPRRFFSETEWDIAHAVADRILPQPDRPADPVPIVPFIDEALHERRGKGYRFDDMPPRHEAWRRGLAAIDDESQRRFGTPFVGLEDDQKDELLSRLQQGEVVSESWRELPPKRFFGNVLVEDIVGEYYAHPAAWSEIGFGGPASPRGYVRLGFNQSDPWEAKVKR